MLRRSALTTLALGSLTFGASAAVLQAQQNTSPAIACGFLLRQSHGPEKITVIDSLRGGDLRRMITVQRAQGGAPGERLRLERTPGWIGVQMTEISETRTTPDGRLVRYCDYPVVVSVESASPAERAGIEPGDTVWAYNGVDLRSSGEIALDLLLVPDDTLRFGVRRNGRSREIPVLVGRRPEGPGWASAGQAGLRYVFIAPGPRTSITLPAAPPPPSAPMPPGATTVSNASNAPSAARSSEELVRVRAAMRRGPQGPSAPPPLPPLFGFGYGSSILAGAQLVTMDDDLRTAVGAKQPGIFVLKVAEGTPAGEAGLRAGDVIVSANGRAIAAPALLQQIFLREAESRALQLRVERKGKVRDVTLRW